MSTHRRSPTLSFIIILYLGLLFFHLRYGKIKNVSISQISIWHVFVQMLLFLRYVLMDIYHTYLCKCNVMYNFVFKSMYFSRIKTNINEMIIFGKGLDTQPLCTVCAYSTNKILSYMQVDLRGKLIEKNMQISWGCNPTRYLVDTWNIEWCITKNHIKSTKKHEWIKQITRNSA